MFHKTYIMFGFGWGLFGWGLFGWVIVFFVLGWGLNVFNIKYVFKVLLSNTAVGISLYEILHCISVQFSIYISFFYKQTEVMHM